MRARSPRQRGNAGWKRYDYPPEKLRDVGVALREHGCMSGDGDPVGAHAHIDGQRRLRRLHASYANGWRATLVLRLDGSISLSQAIKLVTPAKGEPA